MSLGPKLQISPVRESADLPIIAALFRDYAASLSVDLNLQGFEQELAGLPGAYAPPRGELLLARKADAAVGCIALRPLGDDVCEIKRLYVRPAGRGLGVGKMLIGSIVDRAFAMGYREIKLDTLPEMAAARALYERFGFTAIPPYGSVNYPGLICLGLEIGAAR